MAEIRSLENLLIEAFGEGATFRDGQREAIEALLRPGALELLVQSTGWGKSLVYFLAARALRDAERGRTLVVSPLIALMRNQVLFAKRFGLRTFALHSENREQWPEIEARVQKGELDVLLVSPERLQNPSFRHLVLDRFLPEVTLLVVDEVHCVSEWGHDFRPEYRSVLRSLKDLPRKATILGATATATDRVLQDLKAIFGPFLNVRRGHLTRQSLRLLAIPLDSKAERLAWLAKYVPRLQGSGIVYCLTVYDAIQVAQWMRRQGISAEAYHGELEADRRMELEDAFTSNQVKALASTTALGMGYDKADVGFVIHYQTPASLIAYYQQIGRAGRAIDRAHAVLLAGEGDKEVVESLIQSARPARKAFERVARSLERGPLSFGELLHEAHLPPTTLRLILDHFQAADALLEQEGVYGLRMQVAKREIVQGDAYLDLRREEFRALQDYLRSKRCRMQAVAEALGDTPGDRCGICDNCKPVLPPVLDPKLIAEADAFLQGTPRILRPRQNLPVEVKGARRLSMEEMALPGIVLGIYGDSHWGKQVREGKYGSGEFSEMLVEAAAAAIQNSVPAPEWVTAVPPTRPKAPVQEFAIRLAKRLGLPFRASVFRIQPRPPQKSMSSGLEQCLNVWTSFEARDVLNGPCLLVDDVVDSGWTLTAVAARLRRAGCSAVIPLALAAASTGRIKLQEEDS